MLNDRQIDMANKLLKNRSIQQFQDSKTQYWGPNSSLISSDKSLYRSFMMEAVIGLLYLICSPKKAL